MRSDMHRLGRYDERSPRRTVPQYQKDKEVAPIYAFILLPTLSPSMYSANGPLSALRFNLHATGRSDVALASSGRICQ